MLSRISSAEKLWYNRDVCWIYCSSVNIKKEDSSEEKSQIPDSVDELLLISSTCKCAFACIILNKSVVIVNQFTPGVFSK